MQPDTLTMPAAGGTVRSALNTLAATITRAVRALRSSPRPARPTTPRTTQLSSAEHASAPRATGSRSRASFAAEIAGWASIVAGGLVAAVTAPLQLAHGSWCAAYLVLVGGAAQVAMGQAQQHLATRPVPEARTWTQLATWNLGNALVILGTFVTAPFIVDAGGAVLLVSLILAVQAVPGATRRWVGRGYLAVLAVLLVSMPIGLVLAHIRA